MQAHSLVGVVMLLALGFAMANVPSAAASNLREGIWKLNRARSAQLTPADQTLWVIRDDGKQLAWVIVSIDAQGHLAITSWNGMYGGKPAPVMGADMMSQISSSGPGRIQSRGEIQGLGPFSEECIVMDEGSRFVCHGEVQTREGARKWVDDFEWISGSPG